MTLICKKIGLITDFGNKGQHYVAAMKSVVSSINPDIQIMDISHEISSFSIYEASYMIQFALRDFPNDSIIICVVDPGVGTQRKIIAAETRNKQIIISPNNGLFTIPMLYNESGFFSAFYSIDNQELYYHGRDGKQEVSTTFHGRDIISPVAAHLLTDKSISDIGKKIPLSEIIINTQLETQYNQFHQFQASGKSKTVKNSEKNCEIVGSILFCDSFGNLITNIPERVFPRLEKANKITYLNQEDSFTELQISKTFSDIGENKIAIMKGSSGFLEMSMKYQSIAKYLRLKTGDKILLWIE